MTPWLLPLSTGNSLCCIEALFLLLPTFTPRLALCFEVGLEEAAAAHGAIGRAGTLELWLDILPYLFSASETHHALPRPWEDSMPDLRGTQLRTA